MPTYDYKCEDCNYKFEYVQSMSSDRLTVCPKCGGHLRRLIGEGSGIIFKGTGYYCTDYKGKNASMTREHVAQKGKTYPSTPAASTSADKK